MPRPSCRRPSGGSERWDDGSRGRCPLLPPDCPTQREMANLTGSGGMQRQRASSTVEPCQCASVNEAVSIYLADLTYTQQGLQSEIMPNAIGCVGSYAKKRLGDRISIRIFKRPEKLVAAIV